MVRPQAPAKIGAKPREGSGPIDTERQIGREIGIRITVMARLMRQDFDRRIADVGVTRSQWSMIASVARRPGCTQRQVAEILEMSEASAGRLIDRLCADGLLERRERNDDRRAHSVFVTDKARPMLDKLGEIAKSSEARVFRGISTEELEQLSALLDKVYRNLA